MSEEEEKKKAYYYGGKEKKAGEIKKAPEESIVPYGFGDIQNDFDRMIDRFQREFQDFWITTPSHHRHGMHRFGKMMPFKELISQVDLEDRGKDYCVTADLPGFAKNDVDIEVSEDSVIIRAEKISAAEAKEKNYVRRERSSQAFYRRIMLPEPVKSDEAQAKLDNGVLEIVLPKQAPKETKKLKVA